MSKMSKSAKLVLILSGLPDSVNKEKLSSRNK